MVTLLPGAVLAPLGPVSSLDPLQEKQEAARAKQGVRQDSRTMSAPRAWSRGPPAFPGLLWEVTE